MDVAEENGIDIPGLCHLPGIHDRGACRLCVVEIAGSPRLAAACVTQISEGMQVTAHSETLQEYRRTATEMMFLERNHVCAVCVANNHCELQGLADELELTHFELPRISPTWTSTPATSCSRSTTTAASCACAASACATRSRERTPGT